METCWFCEKNPGDQVFKVVMVKMIGGYVAGMTKKKEYSVVEVPIPRCSRCAAIHRWIKKSFNICLIVSVLFGGILSIVLCALFVRNGQTMESGKLAGLIIGLVVLGMASCMITVLMIYRSIKKKKYPDELFGKSKIKSVEDSSITKHPKVAVHFNAGYSIGVQSQRV